MTAPLLRRDKTRQGPNLKLPLLICIYIDIQSAIIAYEAIRHREDRAVIRARRGALTAEEVRRLEQRRRPDSS